MKGKTQSIEIDLLNGVLNFRGNISDVADTSSSQHLEGNIKLNLPKSLKVKTIEIRFRGTSVTHHSKMLGMELAIEAPLLPKLKVQVIDKSIILPTGFSVIPWELEIPNIYPRTFSSKRGSISYSVCVTLILGINRTIRLEHPVIIQRHHCLYQRDIVHMAPKLYDNTIATKFHYQIEAPRIVCSEQGYIPISVKYLSIHQKPLVHIRTQIIQVELCRCRHISKTESDLTLLANKRNVSISQYFYELCNNNDSNIAKFIRYLPLPTIHNIDNSIDPNLKESPLLLLQTIPSILVQDIECPLFVINHQLEITFHFGHKFDEIKAKVPIFVSTVLDPITETVTLKGSAKEQMPLKYTMETEPHTDPLSRVEIEKRPKSTLQKSSSYPDQQSSKWIKKSASDVNLREKVLLFGIHDKRRSVTPPPARPMKHDSVEYSSSSLDEKSPYGLQPPPRHNARSYCESNSSGECESMPTDDDFKSFMSTPYGLPPPPRPTLKPKSNRKSFKSDEGSESSQYLDIFPSNLGSSSPSSSAMSEYFDYLSSESEKPTYSDTVTDHYIKSELPPLPKSEPLFSISSINMNGSKEQYAQYEGSDEEDLAYTRGYI